MIADELNKLKQTKASIKLALIDKGQNPSDVFSTYADDIRAIETGSSSGGGVFDFASLGYTGNEEPFKSGIEYAKEILNKFLEGRNPHQIQRDLKLIIFPNDVLSNNDLTHYFTGCHNLIFVGRIIETPNFMSYTFLDCFRLNTVELLDYSLVKEMNSTFGNCKSLYNVGTIDCTSCTTVNGMFKGCNSLSYNPLINTSNITDMNYLFYDCYYLQNPDFSLFDTSNVTTMLYMFACEQSYKSEIRSINISMFNTDKVKSMKHMFENQTRLGTLILPENFGSACTDMSSILKGVNNIKRIENLNVNNLSSLTYNAVLDFDDKPKLRYFLCKGIGTLESQTNILFTYYKLPNWGIADDELTDARQSVIDSLITYSFDRVNAGYSTSTINLSDNTKALLTEDEIAQITAKGYTIA